MSRTFLRVVIVAALLLFRSHVFASAYVVYQITDNGTDDRNPLISDNGMIVWEGHDGNDVEILLFDGIDTVPLSENEAVDGKASINGSGQVVWQGAEDEAAEIYLYDRLGVTRLTDNVYEDICPDINDAGQVAWVGGGELWLYSGSSVTQLTDDDYYPQGCPDINDNGHIAFSGTVHGGPPYYYYWRPIFVFNGSSFVQVSSPGWGEYAWDYAPRMNNAGQMVWTHTYDYVPTLAHTLPACGAGTWPYEYEITDSGFLAWRGGNAGMRLCDGYTETSLGDRYGSNLHINETGISVWQSYVGGDLQTGYEIYAHDGVDVYQVTENTFNDQFPRISGSGRIVWQAWDGSDWEIMVAVPAQDLDGDGFPAAALGGGDCDDDPADDPPSCPGCACGEESCGVCARCIHRRAVDFCGDGVDGNCDGGEGSPEVCNNGRDDDCDSLADIDDDECWECVTQADCEDGTACTVDECIGHLCKTHGLNCYDGDSCTDDSCDAVTGCVNACTATHVMDPCCTSPACGDLPICNNLCEDPVPDCDDDDTCTDDMCDPDAGCVNTCNAVSLMDPCCSSLACVDAAACNDCADPLACDDGDVCTIDACDPETGCSHTCPPYWWHECCELSPCVDDPVCIPPCYDLDGDGYGGAASPECPYPEEDCDDIWHDDWDWSVACSTCTCGNVDCAGCARCMHPGASDFCGDEVDSNCDGGDGVPEIPGNGLDDDCDPATPAYPEPANTMALSHGRLSLIGSGVFNGLALLLFPMGAIFLLHVGWAPQKKMK